MTRIDVWYDRRLWCQAVHFQLSRHVHRQVPQAQPAPAPEPTGVDYLGLVEKAHDKMTLGRIAYRDLVKKKQDS